MKLGLYSITYLGLWYDGPALSVPELVARAREYGYDGIELDGKRPHANPLDWDPARAAEARRLAAEAGIEIYAVAANNDFSSPMAEQREAQLLYVRELVRLAAALGAPVVRVFAAWPGVTISGRLGRYDIARRLWGDTHDNILANETWDACRACLQEAARFAADAGITLALQNHPPVIDDFRDMLRMVREVGSPHLKACLDAPLVAKQGSRDQREAALATGALQALSHFGGEYDCGPDGAVRGWVRKPGGELVPEDFYRSFLEAMREIGYAGWLGYELCHPLPAIDGRTVGLDFADRYARLAARYMRELMRRAASA
jgi:sugar phosphate isomerase/epimerase